MPGVSVNAVFRFDYSGHPIYILGQPGKTRCSTNVLLSAQRQPYQLR